MADVHHFVATLTEAESEAADLETLRCASAETGFAEAQLGELPVELWGEEVGSVCEAIDFAAADLSALHRGRSTPECVLEASVAVRAVRWASVTWERVRWAVEHGAVAGREAWSVWVGAQAWREVGGLLPASRSFPDPEARQSRWPAILPSRVS